MKKVETPQKARMLSVSILQKATDNDWERYNAVVSLITQYLFLKKKGFYDGRDTAMGKLNPDDAVRTNFWFIKSGSKNTVEGEVDRMLLNFNLAGLTEFRTSKKEGLCETMDKELKRKELTFTIKK